MEVMTDYTPTMNVPITFKEKLVKALEDQGRSKKWLAGFLKVSRQTLYNRLAENDFKDYEKTLLREELGI